MELSKPRLRELSRRHWRNGDTSKLNALRELLERLELRTPQEQRVIAAFDRIRGRKQRTPKISRINYVLPLPEDGRETAIATDAFDRRYSFTY